MSVLALTGLKPLVMFYLMGVTLLSAVVRGFSGFGFSALVVLLATWVLPPVQIVPLVLLLEIIASIHLLPSCWSNIHWPRLRRLLIGSAFSIPLGVYGLAHIDEQSMRLVISLLILVSSIFLLRGYSFAAYDRPALDKGLGVVSGMMTGAAAIGGLAVAVVFLSIQLEIAVIRSTLIALFFATDIYSTVLGTHYGFVDHDLLWTCTLLLPCLFIGLIIGRRFFNRAAASEVKKLVLWLLVFLSVSGVLRQLIVM